MPADRPPSSSHQHEAAPAPLSVVEWRVSSDDEGERLDRAVSAHIVDMSRSYAALLIESGALTINGSVATKASRRLREGDVISLAIPPPQPSSLVAESIPLKVVYEDSDLLVLDKPAGMVVHPAPGHSGGTLVNALLAHVPGIELDMGDEMRPGIVHRLDKDTSGLMVVAKRRAAHEVLSLQMSARSMLKEYVAVVLGALRPPTGVIEAPIARDPRDRQRMAVVEGGRPARTRYTTERRLGLFTLVRATLETGRTHQIRVHMAATGHPVLGDAVYGKRTLKDAATLGLERQFLHAQRLGFTLPSTGEWREFTTDLPEELQDVLDALS
jgi:23S rRNA pseudouridine1911/1915/1917 synthase